MKSAIEVVWALPFLGLLLSIALLPLAASRFWHQHYGKVAAAWALAFLLPYGAVMGVDAALHSFLHALILDYMPFVIVLLTLYTLAGGIVVEGTLRGTPAGNTAFLVAGMFLASVIGTLGASLILIRPLLRANAARRVTTHVVIFFIFLVANIGGALSPLGDPPLFLGYQNGVPFFWPLRFLFWPMAVCSFILLVAFFFLDRYVYRRDKPQQTAMAEPWQGLAVKGKLNVLLMVLLIFLFIMGPQGGLTSMHFAGITVKGEHLLRDGVLLALAALSLLLTPSALRRANDFHWEPMKEIAKLFAALFITLAPVLALLHDNANGPFAPLLAVMKNNDGTPNPALYFWVTGVLSAFLDNAPTYLVCFNLAGGDAATLTTTQAPVLMAISCGAVFMGALSYIGNAPNFMVRSLAADWNVPMPSFFAYMGWSTLVLLPVFALVSLLFF